MSPNQKQNTQRDEKLGREEKTKTCMPSEVAEATQLNKIQNFFNHAIQK